MSTPKTNNQLPKVTDVKNSKGEDVKVGIFEPGTLMGDTLNYYCYLAQVAPQAAKIIARAFAMMVTGQMAARERIDEGLKNGTYTVSKDGKLTLTQQAESKKNDKVGIDVV